MTQRLWTYLSSTLLLLAAAMSSDAQDSKDEKPGLVAHIRLAGNLDETPVAADPLFGTSPENFKSKIDRIQKASEDRSVKALYIHVDGAHVGWSKIEDLRRAIKQFRKTGKKAYAYVDSAEAKDYLLASECDVICMPESGWLVLVGVQAEVTFYKELLEKLGIRADFLQMGVYKFAAEPYTRSSMSKEAKAQLKLVLDDFFDHALIGGISSSRASKNLNATKLTQLIDEGPFTAKRALELSLIDKMMYQDELEALIKKDIGGKVTVARNYGSKKASDIDLSNPFALLKLFVSSKDSFRFGKDRIAIIYATGPIMTGKGGSSLFGGHTVGSTTMVEAIRKAEKDPKVKAIVLRVDSPGGSALASDLIWKELKNCKKPVIASMSDVAASGGYYISMGASKVYAEPGTLTGSIGVVGGKLALAGLYDKVGITTETIARGKNAGIFGTTHPFTASERKAMEKLMNEIYDQFLNKVIEGRAVAGKKFTRAELIKLAEGRIWTGRQAKDLGLVDALGSLEDALADAKKQAGLEPDADTDYLILPKAHSFIEALIENSGEVSLFTPAVMRELARHPDLRVHLQSLEGMMQLRGEPVWLMMPHSLRIR